ncbi:hypothetical protein H6P81_006597 [Aristolochia fimbriata]|uniref:Uncharacterized protein n=1 Tax=Aristolochia fimbriata TaxID=158543 RepID=A0AAV7F2A2_ARIFI|nr:hypothetical protein H6P81_006597 [Aristolochia fimbriata]
MQIKYQLQSLMKALGGLPLKYEHLEVPATALVFLAYFVPNIMMLWAPTNELSAVQGSKIHLRSKSAGVAAVWLRTGYQPCG